MNIQCIAFDFPLIRQMIFLGDATLISFYSSLVNNSIKNNKNPNINQLNANDDLPARFELFNSIWIYLINIHLLVSLKTVSNFSEKKNKQSFKCYHAMDNKKKTKAKTGYKINLGDVMWFYNQYAI